MKTFGKLAVFLLAISIAGFALESLKNTEHQSGVFRHLLSAVPWAGYTHVIAGSVALIIGSVQLSSRLRKRRLSLHKFIGRCYVLCVLISTVGAFISLPFTRTTWPATSAFWVLATLWPIVTLAGYPWKGTFDVQRHGKLMIYSYALTCAAISLRIILIGSLMSGVSFSIAYPISAWGGFLINLFIAFAIVRRTGRPSIQA